MRRGAIAVLGTVLIGLLTGCSGLSTDTAVQEGLAVSAANPPRIGYVPPPPGADATPERLVRGFIRAGSASDGDYEVARLFLTDRAAGVWKPDGEVTVFRTDTSPKVTPLAQSRWRLTVATAATITADGRYRPAAPGATKSVDFGLVKVDGQWRIDTLPTTFARWIETSDVGRLFRSYPVDYFSAVDDSLVPDVRFFPDDHLPTRVAAAQVAAVPAYLNGAVVTGFPPDARLRVGSVPVVDGVATVDLSGSFGGDSKARRAVWVQLAASLTQLPEVASVMVQVDGSVFDFAGRIGGASSTLADLGAGGDRAPAGLPVVRTGATLRHVDPTSGNGFGKDPKGNDPKSPFPAIAQEWRDLAVSRDLAEVAGVDAARSNVSRWLGDHRYEVPLAGSAVGKPAYDVRGWLWIPAVGARQADRLWAVDSSSDPANTSLAKAQAVSAAWLTDRIVRSVRLPLDGQRVAVLSTDAGGGDARLDVAGVIRDDKDRPTGLSAPLRLAPNLTNAIDVTWIGETDLAAVGVGAGAAGLSPVIVGLSGDVEVQSAVKSAASIGSAGGVRDLIVTTSDGRILSRAGTSWVELGKGTDFAEPAG